jgi:hypothetical protein
VYSVSCQVATKGIRPYWTLPMACKIKGLTMKHSNQIRMELRVFLTTIIRNRKMQVRKTKPLNVANTIINKPNKESKEDTVEAAHNHRPHTKIKRIGLRKTIEETLSSRRMIKDRQQGLALHARYAVRRDTQRTVIARITRLRSEFN